VKLGENGLSELDNRSKGKVRMLNKADHKRAKIGISFALSIDNRKWIKDISSVRMKTIMGED
jgi:hypothetical protein